MRKSKYEWTTTNFWDVRLMQTAIHIPGGWQVSSLQLYTMHDFSTGGNVTLTPHQLMVAVFSYPGLRK